MPSKISFSRNLRYYAVDWESFEVDAFPIQDSMKPYVEALCLSVRFRTSGGILLEHDTAWDRGTELSLH